MSPDRPLRPHRRVRLALAAACAACLAAAETGAAAGTAPPSAAQRAQRLDAPNGRAAGAAPGLPKERAVLQNGRDLSLEVPVRPGDTYASIGQRYLADLRELASIRSRNGDRLPPAGATVILPYASLNDEHKVKALLDLYPEDGPRDGNWVHRVGAGRQEGSEESLWSLSLWLTGRGENFGALADRNGIPGLIPSSGQEIVVPAGLLLPPFARLAAAQASAGQAAPSTEGEVSSDDFTEVPSEAEPGPAPPALPPRGPATDASGQLTYGADEGGAFGAYRLKRGEALYSVVMRFTGRVDSQEVNELAQAIAARSGIRDLTGIPIGHRVKLPLDDLLPEYLPGQDPRRQAWEKGQQKAARYINQTRSRNLEGVTVILDAGHGGRDRGAAHNGVSEHEYVYDILCRIKARLEEDTAARVLTTIKDRVEGYRIRESVQLTRNGAEVLLTDPPFPLSDPYAGVNLRWYLTNSYFRRLVAEGSDPLKVVFTSLHADARHPGLGGAMVYVPGEQYRRGRYGYTGPIYARTRESRDAPYVSFTRAERERSEGLSRQFAIALVKSFRRAGVSVHPYDPVRERIVRRRRSWVPAVLRCSEVPVEVLVEVSNLSNLADSRQLSDPVYRQNVADAYVDALSLYYGGAGSRPPTTRMVTSRGN
ncbi:MAG TPA: N-acetylmuramoyl-L-alanine amidase [Candidatus Polarisedimenticolia bacterium]|nr:N-acetylmuramoyl-L-alanine amidase [Candidatus Polarisedimenticolia bacterium]